jgi:Protein of unknown function (DUF2889)
MTREELHFRRIDMRGYRRGDGLFEVEGRVTDRRAHDFQPGGFGDLVPANQAVHDMGVRLVFDEHLVIHDVSTFMDATPYPVCLGGGEALQSLKGLRMGGGWSREVRSRLGGAHSCTHLMELLTPMATVAVQSLSAAGKSRGDTVDAHGKPRKIDSCYAYGAGNALVKQRWPAFHQPIPPSAGQDR